MIYEEAVKISSIIQMADSGCQSCVTSLLHLFMDEFTEVDWDKAFPEGATGRHYWKPVDVVKKAREEF